jgi:hypothetical protein
LRVGCPIRAAAAARARQRGHGRSSARCTCPSAAAHRDLQRRWRQGDHRGRQAPGRRTCGPRTLLDQAGIRISSSWATWRTKGAMSSWALVLPTPGPHGRPPGVVGQVRAQGQAASGQSKPRSTDKGNPWLAGALPLVAITDCSERPGLVTERDGALSSGRAGSAEACLSGRWQSRDWRDRSGGPARACDDRGNDGELFVWDCTCWPWMPDPGRTAVASGTVGAVPSGRDHVWNLDGHAGPRRKCPAVFGGSSDG